MAAAKKYKDIKEAITAANGAEVATLLKSITSDHRKLAETLRCAAMAIEDQMQAQADVEADKDMRAHSRMLVYGPRYLKWLITRAGTQCSKTANSLAALI